MRHWIFHPLIFYPLALIAAALLIGVSLQPQKWPRPPAPVAAQQAQGALVYTGAAFNSPDGSPEQVLFVTRDFWGQAQTLRIAVKPGQEEPAPAERGVRILLNPADVAALNGRPTTVEVTYNPSPVNAAAGLAVSLQGRDATQWISQDIPPQPGTVRFQLPPQSGVTAIGLRALSPDNAQADGLEITRIRVSPRA